MTANQLRMSFSAMAYVLVDTLRRVALCHSQFADASVQTIRLKLLKLGAQVRTSIRRIHFAIASGCPNKAEFALARSQFARSREGGTISLKAARRKRSPGDKAWSTAFRRA